MKKKWLWFGGLMLICSIIFALTGTQHIRLAAAAPVKVEQAAPVIFVPAANPEYMAEYDSREPEPQTTGPGWEINRINIPRNINPVNSVTIAILDTGISQQNSYLNDKIIASVNFSTSPTENDIYGHGTGTADTIVRSAENAGITASLLNVKVAQDDGSTNALAVAQGIVWAADNNADIINCSLVITKHSAVLEEAVRYAWEKGSVIVAAAGNSGGLKTSYPASYEQVISVAATDFNDNLPDWSACGEWISVAAPGVDIYGASIFNAPIYRSGTSLAAALVSAEAAILFTMATDSNNSGSTNDEIKKAIVQGVDYTAAAVCGRINITKAVTSLR